MVFEPRFEVCGSIVKIVSCELGRKVRFPSFTQEYPIQSTFTLFRLYISLSYTLLSFGGDGSSGDRQANHIFKYKKKEERSTFRENSLLYPLINMVGKFFINVIPLSDFLASVPLK